jgi:hypothetical protein
VLAASEDTSATVPLERTNGLGLALLARLARFATQISEARNLWCSAGPRSITDWNQALGTIVRECLSTRIGNAAAHAAALHRDILEPLSRAAHPTLPLEASAYLRLLAEKLPALSDSGSRGSGGITVADLRHYAGVPARVVVRTGCCRSHGMRCWHVQKRAGSHCDRQLSPLPWRVILRCIRNFNMDALPCGNLSRYRWSSCCRPVLGLRKGQILCARLLHADFVLSRLLLGNSVSSGRLRLHPVSPRYVLRRLRDDCPNKLRCGLRRKGGIRLQVSHQEDLRGDLPFLLWTGQAHLWS